LPKSDIRNGVYKLMLNSVFGKSGDNKSFLFDIQFLLSITLNGQLLLCMLLDKLIKLNTVKVIQANTDGITVMLHKDYINDMLQICKDWENITKLELEYAQYKKMIIKDVNNYISQYDNDKLKHKGMFEIDKDFYKDNSFKIIAIALEKYFIDNIPIETTIKNHENIYDFCGRVRAKQNSYYILHYVKNRKPIDEVQPKNVRYYISNNGGRLLKYYNDGRKSDVHVDYKVTVFNKYSNEKNYNINYDFYVRECNKVIDQIIPRQLSLF